MPGFIQLQSLKTEFLLFSRLLFKETSFINDVKLICLLFRCFLSAVVVYITISCPSLPTLFTPVYPFLLSPHASLSPPSCLFLTVIISFSFIPPFLSLFILLSLPPPHPFICLSLTLHALSLLSFSLLSCFHPLPSYPYCLISSHFLHILSSISPSVSLVTLLTPNQRLFCLNCVGNVTFKNQQVTVSALDLHRDP